MRKVLAVDVDITLVDTDIAWMRWLDKLTGRDLAYTYGVDNLPYDVSKLYEPYLMNKTDAMDFWRQEDLYDSMLPQHGSVESLKLLSKWGWDILFVSQIKGNHSKSKFYFLKKYFPFMAGAIWTKEKHYVRCDAIIDDRNKVLQKMPENVKCLKYWSRYDQEVDLTRPHSYFPGWHSPEEIQEVLEGEPEYNAE